MIRHHPFLHSPTLGSTREAEGQAMTEPLPFQYPDGYEFVDRVFDGFIKIDRFRVPDTEHLRVVVRCTNSVSCLLHDLKRKRVLFISQEHLADMGPHNPTGKLVTPVAGRFDRDVGTKKLAVDETWEEAGVRVTEERVILLNNGKSMTLSIGLITERAYMSYVAITEDDVIGSDNQTFGLKSEGEATNRVWIEENVFLSPDFVVDDARVLIYQQHIQIMRLREQLATVTREYDQRIEQAETRQAVPVQVFGPDGPLTGEGASERDRFIDDMFGN